MLILRLIGAICVDDKVVEEDATAAAVVVDDDDDDDADIDDNDVGNVTMVVDVEVKPKAEAMAALLLEEAIDVTELLGEEEITAAELQD